MNAPESPSSARSGLAAEDLPWLVNLPSDGRVVPAAQGYWRPADGFRVALGRPTGYLDLPLEPVHGSYLSADGPALASTSRLDPLGTVVVSRASYPDALEALHKIQADLFTMAASLQKNRILIEHAARTSHVDDLPFLLGCELEYLFVTIRAYFDQMQFLIRTVARARFQQSLPQSFNRMLGMHSEKHKVPKGLRAWYSTQETFFSLIRDVRVGIEHYGHGAPQITLAPGGIAVLIEEHPWCQMPIWTDHSSIGDKPLGSLFRALAWLIDHALVAGDTLGPTLEAHYLTDVTPITEWSLYLYSPLVRRLHTIERMYDSGWEGHAVGMDSHVREIQFPPDW